MKSLVTEGIIDADTEDLRIQVLKISYRISYGAHLRLAGASESTRVESQDHSLTSIIAQRNLLHLLIYQSKFWGNISYINHQYQKMLRRGVIYRLIREPQEGTSD